MVKWIAALLGFMFYGFRGAILGFIIGSFIDSLTLPSGRISKFLRKNSVSPRVILNFILLSLSAIVIKADGR